MKIALVLLVCAIAIPCAYSLKCQYCALGLCRDFSCLFGFDRCITTTYTNSSKAVRACASQNTCNSTASLCKRIKNYCSTDCCSTELCNKPSSAMDLKINFPVVAMMALLVGVFYVFKF